MPCLNPGRFLDEAIASCLEQQELKQLIVADGGSDQKTQQRLEAWSNRDARVLWWSKGDQGPADALNQALEQADAAFIGWLNADDRYEQGALARALDGFWQRPNLQMVYGHGQHIDADGRFVELYPSRAPEVGLQGFQDGCFICQPTVLLRRNFLDQIGGFDPRWRTCFDLDLWLRAFAAVPDAIGFVPALQASTRLHTGTITARQQVRVNLETAVLLHRSFLGVPDHWLATAARELFVNSGEQRSLALAFVGEESSLRMRLEAALQRLEQASSAPQIDKSLPAHLRLLLESRSDLLACGFHRDEYQIAFAQWLLLHGMREYPALLSSLEVWGWLLAMPESGSKPRINQAISASATLRKRLWILIFFIQLYQCLRFVRGRDISEQALSSHLLLFTPGRRARFIDWALSIIHKGGHRLEDSWDSGLNLIGYFSSALGVGEDVRTTAFAMQCAGVKVSRINFLPGDLSGRELKQSPCQSPAGHRFSASLICLTAEETIRYRLADGRAMHEDRYVIGYWPWELPRWPLAWMPALDLVDEIWVSSSYIQRCLEAVTSKPVRLMPLCVDAGYLALKPASFEERRRHRQRFSLPDRTILSLCSFDLSSTCDRKNPWGAVQAFQRAFPPRIAGGTRIDVGLVVKTFPPAQHNRDWERLKQIAEFDPRIHIVEATLDRKDLSALYGCCDVLLSLHRAEGFGRVLAECLQMGLDVIATDWSGNIDFCNGPLAHPVSYELVPVPPDAYPHWLDQHWAEPDLLSASVHLQQVVDRRIIQGLPPTEWALQYRERFSAQVCGLRYRKRLLELSLINEPEGSHFGEPA